MSKLFETSSINGMKLSNRFVRSSTWEGMAEIDGSVTARLIDTMADLARGDVGLINSSHAYVLPEGQAGLRQLGAYKNEQISGLSKMTETIHNLGGKMVMQINHGGKFAKEQFTGRPPCVVSYPEGSPEGKYVEITERHIKEIVIAFADAARRAREAGFDGVQLHSAHGYLLNQFLSPIFNKRRDDYGGSIENRTRIHLEICRAVRKSVGDDYPLLIKLNCSDFQENGLSLEDSVRAAKMLVEAGVNAIEVSGGLLSGGNTSPTRTGIDTEEKEAFFKEKLPAFRKAVAVPLILVGGIRSFGVAERIVETNMADYISMSRPFVREPGLIKRWREGDRRKSECLSDTLCYKPAVEGKGIYCVVKEREKKE